MMRLDLTQNHPVLRTFVELMNDVKRKENSDATNDEATDIQIDDGFIHGNSLSGFNSQMFV